MASESGVRWVKKSESADAFFPTEAMKDKAHVSDPNIYRQAKDNPKQFWAEKAKELIDWFDQDWEEVETWDPPYFHWFKGATTNLAYNCIDRHLEQHGDKPAIIWQPEDPGEEKRVLTYQDLYDKVQKFANVLKDLGISQDDKVTFWLPMIPETAIAALACQRIGAPHSIVYTAFSPKAVKSRMEDAGSEVLITADGMYRRGNVLELKDRVNEILDELGAKNCVVVERTHCQCSMQHDRDFYWDELMHEAEADCEPEELEAETTGFLLYTSGTTGKPKGIKHSIGGYMVQAALTTKWVFDLHEDDLFFSTADIGWITGHSYSLYGPLLLGGTTLWYEGSLDYPDVNRWWQLVDKYQANQFYTAPTALRMLRKRESKAASEHNLSSLRVLGSVGEPIDPDTWHWYFEEVGEERCPIVDTYWQTETGGILLTSLPGIGPFIPGVAGLPLPSVDYDVLGNEGQPVAAGEEGRIAMHHPFPPGMLRGVYNNPDKYKEEYWSKYGDEIYFTGDGGIKLETEQAPEPLIEVIGRLDDVMSVAGHRLGSAEVEDAVQKVEEVMEVAVVGKPHDVKKEVPIAFAILHEGAEGTEELKERIISKVREEVGPVATPAGVYFVDALPSTESGKIIRRFLKALLSDEELGDMTTAKNPECLEDLADLVDYQGPQEIDF